MGNKTKICIAGVDVAYQFRDLKRGFEDMGCQVKTLVIQSFSDYEYDYEIAPRWSFSINNAMIKKAQKITNIAIKNIYHRYNTAVRKLAIESDIFIFMWDSFNSNYSDLEYLKKLGKKIVFIFVGDDARWRHASNQDFLSHGLIPTDNNFVSKGLLGGRLKTADIDPGIRGLLFRLNRIRYAEKYADVLFSKREQAQLQLRPFFHFPMNIYGLDFAGTINNQRKINPVVIHAPTNKSAKGTSFVLDAFERLKREGVLFSPVLVSGMSHQKALELYKNSDIIIDQLILPGGGKFSTEGLAFGKVVLTNMSYSNYPQGFHSSECPIVDVNPKTLFDTLKQLINDYPKRQKIAKIGPKYVKSKLSIEIFCNRILNLLERPSAEFDYYPKYFRDHYIPESDQATRCLNKYNEVVNDLSWYKEFVNAGERDGLIF